jgi:hypothetical protein
MIGRLGLGLLGARAEAVSARVLALVVSLGLLSACADANMGSMLTPTPAPAPAAQSAAVAPPAVTAPPAAAGPPSRSTPAGRPAQSAATPQSLTPEQVNAECWMIAESNKKVRDIDQRLKLVDKCVQERTQGR